MNLSSQSDIICVFQFCDEINLRNCDFFRVIFFLEHIGDTQTVVYDAALLQSGSHKRLCFNSKNLLSTWEIDKKVRSESVKQW